MFYLAVRTLAIVLFKVLFRLQVWGVKNIPLKGGFILAGNHISYLDPPILGVACPRELCFLAKEELFRNALFGRFITALNAFSVSSRIGDVKSLRRAIRELETGKGLGIFPEGARTMDGESVEPMQGVGFLATRTGVPIVPTFIEGSNMALPIHAKFIRLKKIKVYFGRAVRAEDIEQQLKGSNPYQTIAETIMKEISRLKRKEVDG